MIDFVRLAYIYFDKATPYIQKVLQRKYLLITFSFFFALFITSHLNNHEIATSVLPSSSLFQSQSQPEPNNKAISSNIGLFGDSIDTSGYKIPDEDLDKILKLPISQRLELIYPYDKENHTPIEKNILQSHKFSEWNMLGQDIKNFITSWRKQNFPEYEHFLFNDKEIYRFLLREYGTFFPEILEAYNLFPKNILKYDFFRYLVVFAKGGVYSDIDTVLTKPFTEWPSYGETIYGKPNHISGVIGIEGECDCETWKGIVSRRVQFCQWTIQFKKHHPLIRNLLVMIMNKLNTFYDKKRNILTIDGTEFDFNQSTSNYYDGVIELTGPGMFTDAVYSYLNSQDAKSFEVINPNNQAEIYEKLRVKQPKSSKWGFVHDSEHTPNFGWENVTEIQEPILVNDEILILPKVFFNSRPEESDRNLVEHRYHGSWKSSNV
ncbi:hypothetical protein WICMUC_004736 [Wickerhamomyces mucosus]|uniref:Mannosyltransferase n=1 Tax=Wickerhamomyces mucosus TaxID=1378264 RepID=A0A9P8PH95_9ASCO|nr:hypothetical protein WICMUC_004736 [Wickerhamomyces mucosus]